MAVSERSQCNFALTLLYFYSETLAVRAYAIRSLFPEKKEESYELVRKGLQHDIKSYVCIQKSFFFLLVFLFFILLVVYSKILLGLLLYSLGWHVYGLLKKTDRDYTEAIKCYRYALRADEV